MTTAATETTIAAPTRTVLAGKTLDAMTAAELSEREPDAERDHAATLRAKTAAEREYKRAAATGDSEKLEALSAQLQAAENDHRRAGLRLEGIREARAQAEQRERETLIADARKAFEADLAVADLIASIEKDANGMIDGLLAFQRVVQGAVTTARSKLSGQAGKGLRVTGTSMADFTNEQLQRTIEIHLHARTGGFWRSETMPIRGGLTIQRLLGAAVAQLIASYEVRYTQDHHDAPRED